MKQRVINLICGVVYIAVLSACIGIPTYGAWVLLHGSDVLGAICAYGLLSLALAVLVQHLEDLGRRLRA